MSDRGQKSGSPAMRFLAGLVAGALVTGVLLSAAGLSATGPIPTPELQDSLVRTAEWVWRNLGLSLPVFGLVMALYAASLGRLRRALGSSASPDQVRQADQLSDVWISLFFGVGVIWTAIGMRGALVEALAGNDSSGVEVLARMVDGGILLALSTTIFGGIGGYLMRAWKAIRLGAALARYYERESGRDLAALRASVSDIQHRLGSPRPPEMAGS
jgi:hypothetical protein